MAATLKYEILEMWANAQRDGRRAKYRWRPLSNAAKFGWLPLLECYVVTLPRRETRWNLQGCPKLPDRSQTLLGLSSPYCGDMWRRYGCLTSFSPIVDMCLSCEDIARQSFAVVSRLWLFRPFLLWPNLPSNRHHRRCGDCLEGKGENYQVCSVQYCVQQLCTVWCTHIWTD